MSKVQKNLLFNLVGSGWGALMQIVFTPFYLRILGIESYGLVAFAVTLQAALQLLDLGMSPTMNREMAKSSVTSEAANDARDFVRTVEVGYWGLGLLMGACIIIAAPLITTAWLKATTLGPEVMARAVMIIGVMIAVQWPFSLYQGGLIGLQQQGALNAVSIVSNTLLHGGVVIALLTVAPTVTVFFVCRAVVSLLQVVVTRYILWRSLPSANRAPRFNPGRFRKTWGFAAGMSALAFSGLILTQADKVLLSKLLPLADYGYYMLATTLAAGLLLLIVPVYNSIFPQLAALVAANDEAGICRVYHLGGQLMAVVLLPVAVTLAVYGREIVTVWTGNVSTAAVVAPILTILTIGTALNGLMFIPYALQLAYGCTSLGIAINVVFIVLLIPSMVVMAKTAGPVAVASVWVVLNTLYILVGVPLTHRRMLPGESLKWYGDIIPAACVCLSVAFLAKQVPVREGVPAVLIHLALVVTVSIAGSVLVTGRIRNHALALMKRMVPSGGRP
jgi:O-antigen/teichoic acid export membrane protein